MLRVDTKKYLNMLSSNQKSEFFCEYCGTKFVSYSAKEGFCPICEMPTDKVEADAKANAALYNLNALKNDAIKSGDYATASQYVDKISEAGKPQSLYSAGMFYYFYSHMLYSRADYNSSGFMESNAANKELSIAAYSKFKHLMYETIAYCESMLKSSPSLDILYTKFLAELRLKRLKQASISLEALKSAGNGNIFSEYAKMLYASASGSGDALEYINKAIGSGTANALYYLAYALYKGGNLKDSKSVLEATKSMLPMSSVLLYRINSIEKARANP